MVNVRNKCWPLSEENEGAGQMCRPKLCCFRVSLWALALHLLLTLRLQQILTEESWNSKMGEVFSNSFHSCPGARKLSNDIQDSVFKLWCLNSHFCSPFYCRLQKWTALPKVPINGIKHSAWNSVAGKCVLVNTTYPSSSHYALPNIFCISAISVNVYSRSMFSREQRFYSHSSNVTSHCILSNTMFKHEMGSSIRGSLAFRIGPLHWLGASPLK